MQARIDITPTLWATWRERAAAGPDWGVRIALRTSTDRSLVDRAISEAVRSTREDLERADGNLFSTGGWGWSWLRGDLVVSVEECDDLELVLPTVLDRMSAIGVSGRVLLWQPPETPRPPEHAPALACLLRVRGTRRQMRAGIYKWEPDPTCHRAVLTAADRWADIPGTPRSYRAIGPGWAVLEPGEKVVPYLLTEAARGSSASVAAVSDTRFRAIGSLSHGRVTLVVGGAAIAKWRSELAELADLIRELAGELAYGFVRRGWSVNSALNDGGLRSDWPKRPGSRPRGTASTVVAFEDVYAPDAFGVQILGPGYAGRLVPDERRWHAESIGDALLLSHVDAGAWFGEPPIERVSARKLVPTHQAAVVIPRARADLADVLYTRGVLRDAGFDDMADR